MAEQLDPVTNLPVEQVSNEPTYKGIPYSTIQKQFEAKEKELDDPSNYANPFVGTTYKFQTTDFTKKVDIDQYTGGSGKEIRLFEPDELRPDWGIDTMYKMKAERLSKAVNDRMIQLDDEQNALEVAANGVGKLVGKVAVNVLGGLAGSIYGLGSALLNWDASSFYKDNIIFDATESLNEGIDKYTPIYAAPGYDEKNLGERMWENPGKFIWDDLSNAFSFVLAAILTEGAAVGMIGKVGKLTKLNKLGAAKGLNKIAQNADDILVQKALTGASSTNTWKTINAVLGQGRRVLTGAGYESAIEARDSHKSIMNSLITQWEQEHPGEELTQEQMEAFDEVASEGSLGVFFSNLATVGLSNAITFPTIFTKNLGIAKKIKNKNPFNIDKVAYDIKTQKWVDASTKFGRTMAKARVVAAPFTEGGEEFLQGVYQEGFHDYTMAKYNNDPETLGIMNQLLNTAYKRADSKEAGIEFGLGFIMGMVGVPLTIRGNKLRIGLEGGVYGAYKDYKNTRKQTTEKIAGYNLAKHTPGDIIKAHYQHLQTMKVAKAKMESAAANDDDYEFKNAENEIETSLVMTHLKAGTYKDYLKELDALDKKTDEEFQKLYPEQAKDTTREERTELINKAKNRAAKIKEAYDLVEKKSIQQVRNNDGLKDLLVRHLSSIDQRTERESSLAERLEKITTGFLNADELINTKIKAGKNEEKNVSKTIIRQLWKLANKEALTEEEQIVYEGLLARLNYKNGVESLEALRSKLKSTKHFDYNTFRDFIGEFTVNSDGSMSISQESAITYFNSVVEEWAKNNPSDAVKYKDELLKSIRDILKLKASRESLIESYNYLFTKEGSKKLDDAIDAVKKANDEDDIEEANNAVKKADSSLTPEEYSKHKAGSHNVLDPDDKDDPDDPENPPSNFNGDSEADNGDIIVLDKEGNPVQLTLSDQLDELVKNNETNKILDEYRRLDGIEGGKNKTHGTITSLKEFLKSIPTTPESLAAFNRIKNLINNEYSELIKKQEEKIREEELRAKQKESEANSTIELTTLAPSTISTILDTDTSSTPVETSTEEKNDGVYIRTNLIAFNAEGKPIRNEDKSFSIEITPHATLEAPENKKGIENPTVVSQNFINSSAQKNAPVLVEFEIDPKDPHQPYSKKGDKDIVINVWTTVRGQRILLGKLPAFKDSTPKLNALRESIVAEYKTTGKKDTVFTYSKKHALKKKSGGYFNNNNTTKKPILEVIEEFNSINNLTGDNKMPLILGYFLRNSKWEADYIAGDLDVLIKYKIITPAVRKRIEAAFAKMRDKGNFKEGTIYMLVPNNAGEFVPTAVFSEKVPNVADSDKTIIDGFINRFEAAVKENNVEGIAAAFNLLSDKIGYKIRLNEDKKSFRVIREVLKEGGEVPVLIPEQAEEIFADNIDIKDTDLLRLLVYSSVRRVHGGMINGVIEKSKDVKIIKNELLSRLGILTTNLYVDPITGAFCSGAGFLIDFNPHIPGKNVTNQQANDSTTTAAVNQNKTASQPAKVNTDTSTSAVVTPIVMEIEKRLAALKKKKLVPKGNVYKEVDDNGNIISEEEWKRVSTINGEFTGSSEAADRGTIIDSLLRDFISGKIDSLAKLEAAYRQMNKETALPFNSKFIEQLFHIFKDVQEDLKDYKLISDIPTLWGTLIGDKYAGTIDLMGIHKTTGKVIIIDLKTSVNNRRAAYANNTTTKDKDSVQQSSYAELLAQRTGIIVDGVYTLPIKVSKNVTEEFYVEAVQEKLSEKDPLSSNLLKVTELPKYFDRNKWSQVPSPKAEVTKDAEIKALEGQPNVKADNQSEVKPNAPLNTKLSKRNTLRKKSTRFKNLPSSITIEQEKKRLKRILGKKWEASLIEFPELESLKDKVSDEVFEMLIEARNAGETLHGFFSNAVVALYDKAIEGTAYHEAFHVVFNLALSSSQRKALIEEARIRFKEDPRSKGTDLEVEEILADAFADFALSEEGLNEGFWAKIKAFFKNLLNLLKLYKRNATQIDALFRDINIGIYKNVSVPSTGTIEINSLKKKAIIEEHFPDAKMKEAALYHLKFQFDATLSAIRDERNWHHLNNIDLIEEYGQANIITEVVESAVGSMQDIIEDPDYTQEQKIAAEKFIRVLTNNWHPDYVSISEDNRLILNNFNSLILEEFYGILYHNGIDLSFNRGVKLSLKERLERLTKQDNTDDTIEDEDESEDSETITESQVERWQRDSVKESSWSSMPQELRGFFQTIPKYELARDPDTNAPLRAIDGNFKLVESRNKYFTHPESEDGNVVFNWVITNLSNLPKRNTGKIILQKLRETQDTKPFIAQLLKELEANPRILSLLTIYVAKKSLREYIALFLKGRAIISRTNKLMPENIIKDHLAYSFMSNDNKAVDLTTNKITPFGRKKAKELWDKYMGTWDTKSKTRVGGLELSEGLLPLYAIDLIGKYEGDKFIPNESVVERQIIYTKLNLTRKLAKTSRKFKGFSSRMTFEKVLDNIEANLLAEKGGAATVDEFMKRVHTLFKETREEEEKNIGKLEKESFEVAKTLHEDLLEIGFNIGVEEILSFFQESTKKDAIENFREFVYQVADVLQLISEGYNPFYQAFAEPTTEEDSEKKSFYASRDTKKYSHATKTLESLAKFLSKNFKGMKQTSVLSVTGETMYAHTYANEMTRMVAEVIHATPEEREAMAEKLMEDPYLKYSGFPDFLRDSVFSKDGTLMFNIQDIDGLKTEFGIGKEYTKLTPVEWFHFQLTAFTSKVVGDRNNAYSRYPMPTLANASRIPFVTYTKNNRGGIMSMLFVTAAQEANRIVEFNRLKNLPSNDKTALDDENYKKNAGKFSSDINWVVPVVIKALKGIGIEVTESEVPAKLVEIIKKLTSPERDAIETGIARYISLYKIDPENRNKEEEDAFDINAPEKTYKGNGELNTEGFLYREFKALEEKGIVAWDGRKKEFYFVGNPNISTEVLESFILNTALAQKELSSFFLGDPAFYKSPEEYYKRDKQIYSPRLFGDYDAVFEGREGTIYPDKTTHTVVIADIVKPSDDKTIQSFIDAGMGEEVIAKLLSGNNLTDAAAISSLEYRRSQAITLQRWNQHLEDAYQYLTTGKIPDGSVLSENPKKGELDVKQYTRDLLAPVKAFDYHIETDEFGIRIPVQNKFAEFPAQTQVEISGESFIYKRWKETMNSEGFGISFFESTRKIGKIGVPLNITWRSASKISTKELQTSIVLTNSPLSNARTKVQLPFTQETLDKSKEGWKADIDDFIKEYILNTSKKVTSKFGKYSAELLFRNGDIVVDMQSVPTHHPAWKYFVQKVEETTGVNIESNKITGIPKQVAIQEIELETIALQGETPSKYEDVSILFGSQIRDIVYADIDPSATYTMNGEEVSGAAIINKYMQFWIDRLELSSAKVMRRFLREDGTVNFSELKKVAAEYIVERRLGNDLLLNLEDALSEVEDEETIKRPLYHPVFPQKLSSLIYSFFRKNIIDQKIAGAALVNASAFGFDERLSMKVDKKSGVLQLECYVPKSLLKNVVLNDDGTINLKKTPKEALELIGYRIPTENAYSTWVLKVVGLSDDTHGGRIVLPIEITTLAGLDFDVDKFYIFKKTTKMKKGVVEIVKYKRPETTKQMIHRIVRNQQILNQKTPDGELVATELEKTILLDLYRQKVLFKSGNRELQNQLDELYEAQKNLDALIGDPNLPAKHKKKIILDYEANNQTINELIETIANEEVAFAEEKGFSVTEEHRTAIELIAERAFMLEDKYLKTKEEADNELVEYMQQMMQLPMKFKKALTPATTEHFKKQSYINYIVDKYLEKIKNGAINTTVAEVKAMYDRMQKVSLEEIETVYKKETAGMPFHAVSTDTIIRDRNASSAGSIGIAAVNNIGMIKFALNNIRFKKPVLITHLNGKKEEVRHVLNTNIREMEQSASDITAELVATTVDEPKDPILGNLNITQDLMSFAIHLFRLGLNKEEVSLFMKNPVFKKAMIMGYKTGASIQSVIVKRIKELNKSKSKRDRLSDEEMEAFINEKNVEYSVRGEINMQRLKEERFDIRQETTFEETLSLINKLYKDSEHVRDILTAIRIDRKGIQSKSYDTYSYQEVLKRLQRDLKTSNIEAFDVFNILIDKNNLNDPDTMIRAFFKYGYIDPIKVLKKIYPEMSIAFMDFLELFKNDLGGGKKLNSSQYNAILGLTRYFALTQHPSFAKNKYLSTLKEKLLIDLAEFKHNNPDSVLLEFLSNITEVKKNAIDSGTIIYSPNATNPELEQRWKEMLSTSIKSDNQQERELVLNLLLYTNSMSFGRYSPLGFAHLTPSAFYDYWNTVNNGTHNIDQLYVKFFKDNFIDTTIDSGSSNPFSITSKTEVGEYVHYIPTLERLRNQLVRNNFRTTNSIVPSVNTGKNTTAILHGEGVKDSKGTVRPLHIIVKDSDFSPHKSNRSVVIKSEKEGKVSENKIFENRLFITANVIVKGRKETLLYKLVPGSSPLLGHTFYELVEPLGIPFVHTEMNANEDNLQSVYPENNYGISDVANITEIRDAVLSQITRLKKGEIEYPDLLAEVNKNRVLKVQSKSDSQLEREAEEAKLEAEEDEDNETFGFEDDTDDTDDSDNQENSDLPIVKRKATLESKETDTNEEEDNNVEETAETIYSKLGNTSANSNVEIDNVAGRKASTKKGIVAYRTQGNNFLKAFNEDRTIGNPWNQRGYGLYKTDSIKESVIEFTKWLIGEAHTNILQDYRQLIINNIDNLKGKKIIYYEELNEPSHATALDYLINKYNWGKQLTSLESKEAELNNKLFHESEKSETMSEIDQQALSLFEQYKEGLEKKGKTLEEVKMSIKLLGFDATEKALRECY